MSSRSRTAVSSPISRWPFFAVSDATPATAPAPPVSTTETGTSVGTSGSVVSGTTRGPTRSAYHADRRSWYAATASASGTSPGGNIAASSTRPAQAAGTSLTRPANHRPRSDASHERGPTASAELGGDDRALDLAGALPDALHPQLAEETLGHVLAHVAATAEHLDGAVGDPARHLAAEELHHRALCVRDLEIGAAVQRSGHLVEHRASREHLGEAVGEHALDELLVREVAAADAALCRERLHLVDQTLRGAQAPSADHQPLVSEPLVDEGHPSVLRPDQLRGGDAHLLEGDDRMVMGERVGVRRRPHDPDAR